VGESGKKFVPLAQNISAMIHSFVTYQCKADSKGRVTIPVGLKAVLDKALQENLILKPSIFKPCIELYPQGEWQEIMEKMRTKLNLFSKQHLDYLRKYTAGVKEAEVDATGRFLIPKPLCEFAKIDKEVVLAPALNFIEIWDKELYEQEINSISEEDFMALTEKIMGDDAGQ
jgi:protein mraZ